MTINYRSCKRFNTISKSFIKCCNPYSVTGFTNTSHTGRYKQHEPLNKLHKAGWSHSTLSPKLGSVDPRPVGSPNCGWLPIRPTKDTTPVSGTKSDKNHSGEFKSSDTRGNRTVIKRGNSGDPIDSTQLHLPDIPSGEEGWWAEASDKPERPQSVCEGGTFQDGGSSPPSRSPTIRGLDGEDGPKRCIPPSAHQSRPSTLLSFLWEEKYYMFTCLPFGLSAAPRVFTKLMKPVVGFLRQVGCRLIIYLDNLLFLHQDKDRLRHMVQLISQLFEGLGLMVNHKKSILLPAQNLGFLGFNINSQTMQISLPQEKMRKIQQDSSQLLAQQSVSVHQIAQFVGKTTATLRALPTAPLHYRALQFLMNSVAPVNYTQEGTTDKFNTIVQLDPESKTDLTWWSSLNRKDLSTPVIPPAPSVTIESDASNQGWGAVLEGQTRTGGVWTAEEATHHINYLELLAAFLAIKEFGKD